MLLHEACQQQGSDTPTLEILDTCAAFFGVSHPKARYAYYGRTIKSIVQAKKDTQCMMCAEELARLTKGSVMSWLDVVRWNEVRATNLAIELLIEEGCDAKTIADKLRIADGTAYRKIKEYDLEFNRGTSGEL